MTKVLIEKNLVNYKKASDMILSWCVYDQKSLDNIPYFKADSQAIMMVSSKKNLFV